MASPIIKEEKIEIKQGMLKIASEDRSIFTLKRWKQRYFVFCQIRKGDNDWLKLFYYKSHSSYKEGNIPKGSIDITTAKEIGLVDRDLYGLGHIIYIGRPDKTHWLSASLCDERSQWLLALRAYKYSDESKLPCEKKRAFSWHGQVFNQDPTDNRGQQALDSYANQNASSQKLRKNYPVCQKCRGIDVPKEVYEWVRPEDSDIYVTIHGPSNRPYSFRENIYAFPNLSEEQLEGDGGIFMRRPIPLPSEKSSKEGPLSGLYVNLAPKSGQSAKPVLTLGVPETAFTIVESDDEKTNSTLSLSRSSSIGDYISMTRKKDGNESEVSCSDSPNTVPRSPANTLPVPSKLISSHRSDSPHSKGSPDGILLENKRMSANMSAVHNKYTPEPVLRGSMNVQNDSNENKNEPRDSVVMIKDESCQEQISDNRDAHSSGKKQSGGSKMLQRKLNTQNIVFLAEL